MQTLIDDIISVSKHIRYVAVYSEGKLTSAVMPGLMHSSTSESDMYEELIVNPAILTLAKQRGDIDCGGCRFVLIRYGNFYQYVTQITSGHVSVCIELNGNPLDLAERIEGILSVLKTT